MSILDIDKMMKCLGDEYKVLQQSIFKPHIFKENVDVDWLWQVMLAFPEECIKEFAENLIKESCRDDYFVNIVRNQKSPDGRDLLIIDIEHRLWYGAAAAATIIFIKNNDKTN